jgi:hypothetical protein
LGDLGSGDEMNAAIYRHIVQSDIPQSNTTDDAKHDRINKYKPGLFDGREKHSVRVLGWSHGES